MGEPLVIGADVGGTSSKAVLCDPAGRPLGRGDAPGGNVNSSTGEPARNIAAALGSALAGQDPDRVVAGVIGLAGSAANRERAQRIADDAWRAAGLTGSPRVVTDLEIGYAAGATGPDGVLLLAGTGAVGAAFRGYALHRRCDGLGWLLGDEGSAVWFGLTAVRAAVAALDGRAGPTALTGLLAAAFAPDQPTGDPRQDLVRISHQVPPARFGELAPLVVRAAVDGDPVAGRILSDGCAALVRSAAVAAGDTPTGCLVLAGSLLTTPGPIADRVCAGLAERFTATPVPAPDPVAGAVLGALRAAGLPVLPDLPARLRLQIADLTPSR